MRTRVENSRDICQPFAHALESNILLQGIAFWLLWFHQFGSRNDLLIYPSTSLYYPFISNGNLKKDASPSGSFGVWWSKEWVPQVAKPNSEASHRRELLAINQSTAQRIMFPVFRWSILLWKFSATQMGVVCPLPIPSFKALKKWKATSLCERISRILVCREVPFWNRRCRLYNS